MSRRVGRGAATALALAVATAACAGGSDDRPDASATGTATEVATTVAATTTIEVTRTTGPPTTTATTTTTTTTVNTATTASTTSVSTTAPPVPATGFDACAAALPLRERIALLVWPAVYSVDWPGAVRTVEEHQVGGVILMEPDGWSAADVAPSLARLDAAATRGLVVATDEEGGVVQRLAILGLLPSQQAASEERTVDEARQLVTEHGRRLADAGVDMALGPVVDVTPETGDVPLTRSRFFTGDPATVTAYARAYVEGWQASGVAPVLKHYPGHGAASGDTHDEAGITPALDELERRDLVPFRTLRDLGPAVMIGHLTVPGLTDGLPATQSERAVRYLRDELGYADSLLLTDALGMQAVGLPEDIAAVRALAAGIDVVIFTVTSQTGPVIDAIEHAVADGTLTDDRITQSAARVLRRLDAERTGCAGESAGG